MFFEDQLRRFFGDRFDFNATLGAYHEHRLCDGAIQNDPEVEFASDITTGFDKNLIDRFTFRPSLNRYQSFTNQALSSLPNVIN